MFDPKDEDTEEVLRVRISLAQAFAQMITKGYDALLHYGINFRDLPEYRDSKLIDEGSRLSLLRGQEKYMEWMKRVENGIRAAINRKTFRKV